MKKPVLKKLVQIARLAHALPSIRRFAEREQEKCLVEACCVDDWPPDLSQREHFWEAIENLAVQAELLSEAYHYAPRAVKRL